MHGKKEVLKEFLEKKNPKKQKMQSQKLKKFKNLLQDR